MSKAHADRLAKALEKTGLCQAVMSEVKGEQLRVLLRLGKNADQDWIKVVDRILAAGEEFEGSAIAWQSHICKHYFRKEAEPGQRRLVFGWYVSIQSPSLTEALDEIVKAINGSMPKKREQKTMTMEMPLGINHDLNVPTEKNKGAWSIGSQKGQDFRVK